MALIDDLGTQVDQALGEFRRRLAEVRNRVLAADGGASLAQDGAGADSLRSYEYGLLLNGQHTADRVTRLARREAEQVRQA